MYNILVCDDDKEIVEAIEIYLTQEGYRILKAYDGTDCGQDQKVDVETAVKLYTGESAKAAGFRRIGQLKKGYKAHFAILDRNLFTIPKEEIDQVKVEALYMNGECIYQR